MQDAPLRPAASALDRALVDGDDFEVERRPALVVERLTWHLGDHPDSHPASARAHVATRARDLRVTAFLVCGITVAHPELRRRRG